MTNRRVIIALKGLGALANHGVYDFERDRNQRFSADIVMWVETAGTADDIAATVSYADIADEAMAVLTGTAVDLIETLAETIASHVMSHEGVVGTEVTVHKPDAPIDHPFADVSVTVRAGQTEAMPLSLSLKGVYEAEDGSVLTGEIEAYGRAQAPSPAEQEQSGALPTRRDVQAAHAAPAHDATRPEYLRSRRVVLAIGGNLGDVPVTLMHTVEALSYMEGFQIDDVSPIMRTKPVLAPGQAPQPDYWNAVVVGSAIATPDELFAQTSRIERELGRERHQRWGARTVDIDIIQIEGLASSDPVLTLPHPRAKERAFVLAPWILCEPDAVLEGVGRVSDLLADTPDREGIIDAVDDWLEDPAAVMADSDQLLALRAEQASADMRELIEALTGEISQVSDLVTRPGEPAEPVEIPAAHTVIEDSGDDVEEAADSESAPEQAEEPEAAPVSAAEAPAPRASIWSRLAAAQASDEASSAEEPEASEPELDESASHGIDVPDAEAPAADAAAPADETDAAPQGEAPADEAPTAPAVPGPPHRQRRRRADEAKASSRPSWHPVSSVPADSPAGRMTRKIGTGTYKPSGTEKPRWAPVFESKREESRSKIALPDWNFSVGASHDVRVVDDRSGLGRDDEAPKATVHADGRSTILAPGLPDNTPVGPIPEEEATQTGILRRVVVRPTMTGAVPIVKRR
ncbi:2-amino-4-hydroxy-6-hydroxymethyldihydropteridine diphosphokinase [Schaalia dentiphila]|uniref:Bifunctional folate synthesis protein n=1 Tax=Schaalia dentiphila ATCC 17982 TaxID=411466 RepID=A7BBN6_9ACTO|nr:MULTISPECIES: 2-amino-4-hydroxy-6-hydroxymethyldihydropteridine diphosphokinase [Schaalia]EDN80610.1 2-amino-4-hydroxy-6-hydroxymethyldihydropteridine diphosphokinase [Schaalia odontolytica ATCC 17982]